MIDHLCQRDLSVTDYPLDNRKNNPKGILTLPRKGSILDYGEIKFKAVQESLAARRIS